MLTNWCWSVAYTVHFGKILYVLVPVQVLLVISTFDDIVVFNPEQIGYFNYGIYGRTKYEIFGYLEKSRVPYNQLKLLEIY